MENIIEIQEEVSIEQNDKKIILEKGDKIKVLESFMKSKKTGNPPGLDYIYFPDEIRILLDKAAILSENSSIYLSWILNNQHASGYDSEKDKKSLSDAIRKYEDWLNRELLPTIEKALRSAKSYLK